MNEQRVVEYRFRFDEARLVDVGDVPALGDVATAANPPSRFVVDSVTRRRNERAPGGEQVVVLLSIPDEAE